MKILWLTWKDRQHPASGGAEVVNEELAKRLVADGHEMHFIVGNFKKKNKDNVLEVGEKLEERDGFTIKRIGSKYTAFLGAFYLYWKEYRNWPDLVIDEVNTVPYFSQFYIKQKRILFIHQLCREIWFYQIKFPISIIGYLVEPIYLWLMRKQKVITVSESTKQDLMRFGFKQENINIISEGTELQPVQDLENVNKFPEISFLSLGEWREMKRTLDIVKAFEVFMDKFQPHPPTPSPAGRGSSAMPKLIMAGSMNGEYAETVKKHIQNSKWKDYMQVEGRVSEERKIELMQKCVAIVVASLKEGWGLIVTEAASQGTPAIVYSVDGLRDSVKNNWSGYVTEQNTPEFLANKMSLLLTDYCESNGIKYKEIQENAYDWSKQITFEESYKDFRQATGI